ncbi:PREDICTED: mucolipin-2-like isoform X2 [Amphimedon queenslandica]|nr:PREDICTED: mucolipin-2-like isoform X2 [Amphimedon queenslandica]|eukprot:XP_011405686.2 PREDICTED: mucolipin-2-like isoform X2 [Amphimedon queenslandica]
MSRNYSSSRTSGGPVGRSINNDPGVGGEERSSSKRDSVDPIDSLTIRSRKRSREDFSFKSCFTSFCQKLYNFTIASCQYSFCYFCYSKVRRGSYQNMENFENEPDGSTEGIRAEIEAMKSELKFHFMNPFQKWKYDKRRRFPWKLLVHMIVITLVTIQLCVCAEERRELKTFVFNNRDTFNDLFIIKPIANDRHDPLNYYGKASAGTIRKIEDLWGQINHTIITYYSIKTIAIGPYQYGSEDDSNTLPPPLILDLILFDYKNSTTTISISKDADIHELLYDNGVSRSVTNIDSMTFKFNLSSFYKDQNFYLCATFHIEIELKNNVIDGTMPVYLRAESEFDPCEDDDGDQKRLNYRGSTQHDSVLLAVLGSLVLLFTIISTAQCIRSLVTSARFTKRVKNFFLKHFNYKLSLSEYLPLYNVWFMGVICSNVLVVVGTIMFLFTAFINEGALFELSDVSSIIFGMGVFFQWLGLLRFLSYFDKYNILLITLRLAIPSVIRFMVCGFIFYVAFLLLGWLVLGPYHPKFADPSVTSECLYSLINGDDMFNTYIQMDSSSFSAFIFSKIYLYVFISLFIYVVLSVFISLISDTYETLHEVWTVRSRGFLQDFANDCLIETTDEGQTSQTNIDNDFEVLTGSNRGSTDNSPLLHRPVTTYLGRSGQFRTTTPTVHLHPAANSPLGQTRVTASYSAINNNNNNSSPEMERAPLLYPRLTGSRNHV